MCSIFLNLCLRTSAFRPRRGRSPECCCSSIAGLSSASATVGYAPLWSMKHRTFPGTPLEEIRLLTNLETASEKLLQIVLSGQPELENKLRNPIARQLRQRVSLWCKTRPFTGDETEAYIAERLRIAGASQPAFSPDAIQLVHRYSSGIPRVINLLCEHAMISAFVEQIKPVPCANC